MKSENFKEQLLGIFYSLSSRPIESGDSLVPLSKQWEEALSLIAEQIQALENRIAELEEAKEKK
ncbi:MAG: hypothetical protein ACYS8W_08070 [Planctomycetota bacterium]|jgi:hypothetical protein